MTRDEWIFAFADAVHRANLGLGDKYLRTTALSKWVANSERPPETVAKEWMKARPPDAGRRR